MKTFFTADLHLFHRGVLGHPARRFQTVEEMNSAIIERWNSKVGVHDTVYFLGDLSFANLDKTLSVVGMLNGQIKWVPGNHDKALFRKVELHGFMEPLRPLHTVKVQDEDISKGHQRIVLCHYPLLTWDMAHHGAWHAHGHSHGNLRPMPGRRIDVGVDCFDLYPVEYEELKVLMAAKEHHTVDHHAEAIN